jgi:hypothetical protein
LQSLREVDDAATRAARAARGGDRRHAPHWSELEG